MDFQNMKQSHAARALGVVRQTLAAWEKSGCPRNDDGTYSLPEVVAWAIERAKTESTIAPASPEADMWLSEYRKQKALMAKMQREQMEGSLVPLGDVVVSWGKRMAEVAAMLQQLPMRLPPLLEGKGQHEMHAEIDRVQRDIRLQYCREGKYCEQPTESDQ